MESLGQLGKLSKEILIEKTLNDRHLNQGINRIVTRNYAKGYLYHFDAITICTMSTRWQEAYAIHTFFVKMAMLLCLGAHKIFP